MGFEVQWDSAVLLFGILLVVCAFIYVLYNTVSSVREAVHKNFQTQSLAFEAGRPPALAPIGDRQVEAASPAPERRAA